MKKIESFLGSEINYVIKEMIARAFGEGENIEFDFNGVTVQVAADSDADLILRDWQRGMLRESNTFTVSPYPAKDLTNAELAEDENLKIEREKRHQEMMREYEAKMKAKKDVFDKAVAGQTFQVVDAAKWQSWLDANQDGYGAGCVRFAENWARLMQSKISDGANLEDIAEQCSFDADTEGITGFMYGAAVSMLSQCWIHGERLRVWHNLKTQIGNEGEKANLSGGVLNPAVLNVG